MECDMSQCFDMVKDYAEKATRTMNRLIVLVIIIAVLCTAGAIATVITCSNTITSMSEAYFGYEYEYPAIVQEQGDGAQRQEIGGNAN